MESSAWQEAAFDLGVWHVEPRRTRLVNGEREAFLEPKVMHVLVCLARRPGQVVTRAELMEAVWGDVVVGEEVLTRAISEIRRALADDARRPRYVETVPKVGYRLVAPVTQDHAQAARVPGGRSHHIPLIVGVTGLLMLLIGGVFWRTYQPARPAALLQATPLSSLPGMEIDPAFSPDGSRIAFARREPDAAGWRLFLKGLEGGRTLALTEGAAEASERFPVWSPDGTQIAFVRYTDATCGIYVISAFGGALRKLASCPPSASVLGLDWTPDGRTLVYAERMPRARTSRLIALVLKTRERRLLTDGEGYTDALPVVAPDGSHVAFIRTQSPGVADVYRLAMTGGIPERVTNAHLSLNGLAWTRDGRYLVFSSYHGSNYNLWQVSAEGGHVRRLATGHGSINHPTIAAHRDALAYVRWSHDTNVWRLPTSEVDAEPEAILVSTQADLLPQVSPDGRRLAFVSERSGLPELWVSALDGTNAEQLTTQGGYFSGPMQWSPDGQQIAYARVDAEHGQLDVYVVAVESGVVRRVTAGMASDVAPFWSPDGQWLYFGSDRDGRWNLWKTAWPDGDVDAAPVPQAAGMVGYFAPDGHHLYFARPDTSGIWRLPVAGGRVEHIPVALNPVEDVANWSVTDEGIYFVQRTRSDPSSIVFYDLARGTTTVRPVPKVIQRNAGLTLSPDANWIYYTQVDRSESDLMLVRDGFAAAIR